MNETKNPQPLDCGRSIPATHGDYKNLLHLDVVDRYLRRMGDYKNPQHLDVVDRYLRRMGDKTIPNEAPPSPESFLSPMSGRYRSTTITVLWILCLVHQ